MKKDKKKKQKHQSNDQIKVEEFQKLQERVNQIEEDLTQAKERERRALADYQNLVKRNRQERLALIDMANRDLIQAILEPYENLKKAHEVIEDQGLDMVVKQFRRVFDDFGLEEINPLGEDFDVETMEVVDKQGSGDKVVKVMNNGYILNDQVIQHAKVVVGEGEED